MSSGQDYLNQILESVRQNVSPKVDGLTADLREIQNCIASASERMEQQLLALREADIPAGSAILDEAMEAADSQRARERLVLAQFTRAIRQGETQEEILTLLLDSSADFAPLAALMILRGDQIAGWSSRGYPNEVAQRLAECSFNRSDSEFLMEAFETHTTTSITEIPTSHALRDLIPESFGGPWHLTPLRVFLRPVALLITQGAQGKACDAESLSTMMDITGMCLENLTLRIMQEMQEEQQAQAAPPPVDSVESPTPSTTVESEPQPPAPEIEAEVQDHSVAPEEAFATTSETSAPEDFLEEEIDLSADLMQHGISGDGTELLAGEEMEEPDLMDQVQEEAGTPDPEPILDEPVQKVDAPPVEPRDFSQEEKFHSEAKRFARLLVSEIKLYNEQRVLEGRENRDIYVRLKKDIDRSRDFYEQRVAPVVASKIDYFHDEVIRILGENDSTALGSDYPGPRVES